MDVHRAVFKGLQGRRVKMNRSSIIGLLSAIIATAIVVSIRWQWEQRHVSSIEKLEERVTLLEAKLEQCKTAGLSQ